MDCKIKKWFRFGLPLGSAFITAMIMDSVTGFYWLLIDLGSLLYFHLHYCFDLNVFNLSVIVSRSLMSFLLPMFLYLNFRCLLILWIPLSVICDLVLSYRIIFHESYHAVSTELWFFNVAVLVLFRTYVTLIIVQCIRRLVANERIFFHESEEDEYTDKFHKMEPIGCSPAQLWTYFESHSKIAAIIMVTVELVWNTLTLCTHAFIEFFLGGQPFFMTTGEEVHMRFWRILLCFTGLIFIHNDNKTCLRFWLIAYPWTIFASLCMYGVAALQWVGLPYILGLGRTFVFLCDNVLRICVMYFCLQATIQKSHNGDKDTTDVIRRSSSSLH